MRLFEFRIPIFEINFNDPKLANTALSLPIQCGFEAESVWTNISKGGDIDTDYLVNSDIKKYLNCDVFSPFINHYQQTIDAQFIFISKHRLHEYDSYFNIIDFYEDINNNSLF